MKNPVSINGFLITAALWIYIVAGALVSGLFMLNVYSLSRQTERASHTQTPLYDIRPELNKAADTTPAPSEEDEEPSIEEVHYYAFTTTNKVSILHVRKEPSMDAEIIFRLPPASTGYVLERGESWSLIQTPEISGYCNNGYLDFQEVSEEEYLVW